MFEFTLSCLILLSIVLWWAEAKHNYFYGRLKLFKRLCAWIKNQTKLEIDICKWFLPSVLIFFIVFFLWNSLYAPYFKETITIKEGVFQLKDYSEAVLESQKNQSNQGGRSNIENETINNNERESPIGDWGTFGDFIGGTLNPIIGLISVLLLFGTWRVTSNTLDISKKELRNSNELLSNQQFDAIFWGLFHNLKRIEEMLFGMGDSGSLKVHNIYYNVFRCSFSSEDKTHSLRRRVILQDAELSQYFICLYQIFKNIDERISLEDKIEEKKIKKAYANILRASIPSTLLQLLAVNCHEDFEEYKKFLENYSFFEHMPFYIIDSEERINLGLLECLPLYDDKVFDKSVYYKGFKEKYYLNLFFENKIKDYKVYISDYLMKDFCGEKCVEDKSLGLILFLRWNNSNFNMECWGSFNGEEQQKEFCGFTITMNGMEIQLGGLNYFLVINSFSENLLTLTKKRSKAFF